MPIDAYDEDEGREQERGGRGPTDFDCPSCNANNPTESALKDRDEVLCNYCGGHFLVRMSDEGRVRFKEL
jgi:transcription elongation factor Elf1